MALETWPEKVSKTIRIRHHWIFWIILPEVLFLGQFLLIRFQDSDAHGLTAFAIYLILLSYLALLMPFNARILRSLLPSVLSFVEDDEIAVRSWFHGELKRFFSFRRDFAAFLFVGPALCGSLVYVTDFFHHRRPWFGNTISDYYGLAVFILFCLFCSHYIRFSIHLGFFVKRLSTFPIKITIYQHPVTSVRALGKMMFVISLGGTGCLTIAYFGIFFSPLPIGWIVVFWMGLGGALLLCMFILPQYAIHRIMADIKHEKLESFAKHLETATTVALEDPSNENIERFEKLYNVQQYLSKGMHEWPFDLGALLTLFSAIILPLLAAVIQVLLQ